VIVHRRRYAIRTHNLGHQQAKAIMDELIGQTSGAHDLKDKPGSKMQADGDWPLPPESRWEHLMNWIRDLPWVWILVTLGMTLLAAAVWAPLLARQPMPEVSAHTAPVAALTQTAPVSMPSFSPTSRPTGTPTRAPTSTVTWTPTTTLAPLPTGTLAPIPTDAPQTMITPLATEFPATPSAEFQTVGIQSLSYSDGKLLLMGVVRMPPVGQSNESWDVRWVGDDVVGRLGLEVSDSSIQWYAVNEPAQMHDQDAEGVLAEWQPPNGTRCVVHIAVFARTGPAADRYFATFDLSPIMPDCLVTGS
jgi:hypothetical protein